MLPLHPPAERDLSWYKLWVLYIPFLTLIVILIISIFVLILIVLVPQIAKRYARIEYIHLPWGFRFIVDAVSDLTFRLTSFWVFGLERKNHGHGYRYYLYGVRIYLITVQYLFLVVLTIACVCFMIFFTGFLTLPGLVCSDFIPSDCFAIHNSNFSAVSDSRITDCNEFTNRDDMTVVCFQIRYGYSEGIGAGGGYLFSMQLATNTLINIVLKIVLSILKVRKVRMVKDCQRNREAGIIKEEKIARGSSILAKAVAIPVVMISYFLLLVMLPVWLYINNEDFKFTLATPQRQLELFLFEYTMLNQMLIPLFVAGGIYGRTTFITMDVSNYTECNCHGPMTEMHDGNPYGGRTERMQEDIDNLYSSRMQLMKAEENEMGRYSLMEPEHRDSFNSTV